MCRKALEMEFSLLTTDDLLPAALQKYDFKGMCRKRISYE